jgi:hypothetical protein
MRAGSGVCGGKRAHGQVIVVEEGRRDVAGVETAGELGIGQRSCRIGRGVGRGGGVGAVEEAVGDGGAASRSWAGGRLGEVVGGI